MRAARAAKEHHEATGPLVEHLDQILEDSNRHATTAGHSTLVEYLHKRITPLLKAVITELCNSQPENPGLLLGFWLFDKCGAPEKFVTDIRRWTTESAGEVQKPFCQEPMSVVSMPNGSGPSPPRRPSILKNGSRPSILKKAATSGALLASMPEEKKESAPVADPTTPQRRESKRVSISHWGSPPDPRRSNMDDQEDTIQEDEEEDSDDDDDANNQEETNDAIKERNSMALLRCSMHMQQGRDSQVVTKKFHNNLRDNKRRFSLAVSSVKLPMPEESETIQLLQKVPFFKRYNEEELKKISEICECCKYELDENVVSFNCPAEALHIVVNGNGKVSEPRQVGQVVRGDVFGQEALQLAGAVSPTQVEALGGPLTTISIPAQLFNRLDIRRQHLEKSKQEKQARLHLHSTPSSLVPSSGISGDSGKPIVKDYQQSASDRELIIMSVKNNKVLAEVLQLSNQQYEIIADTVHLIEITKGDTLMKKGDQGSALYILQDGLLEVSLTSENDGDFKIRPGDSFGELALLYDTPRAATITAVRESRLWVLPRSEFRLVTRMNYCERISTYSDFISNVPCLEKMVDAGNLDMIAGILEEVFVLQGEEICTEGEDSGFLFIIYEGEVEAWSSGHFKRKLTKGDWAGEEQLVKDIPAVETLVVKSDAATALLLDKSSLFMVTKAVDSMKRCSIDLMSDMLTKNSNGRHKSLTATNPYLDHMEKEQFADNFLKRRMSKTRLLQAKRHEADIDITKMKTMGVLGEGAFGSVFLLSDEADGKFALKGLFKEHIMDEGLGKVVQNERSVMSLFDNPFVVKLARTYQDRKHIFFLMEAVLGGELFDVYEENDLFGNMDCAKFFVGCVTLALQHMHLHRVIYRDLKLENCLLDERGYLKITDMGIAKMVMGKTYTVCGTADYFAPETLKQTGYNRAIDWWACGVLLFIMAAGRSPFDAPDVTQIYKNIIKGFSKVKFPSNFTSDLIDTIKSLCRKKPEERVTMQKGGCDNLMAMPFFIGIDWVQLEAGSFDPPHKPPPVRWEKFAEKKLSRSLEVNLSKIVDWDGSLPEGPVKSP